MASCDGRTGRSHRRRQERPTPGLVPQSTSSNNSAKAYAPIAANIAASPERMRTRNIATAKSTANCLDPTHQRQYGTTTRMRPTIPELAVREAAPGEDLLRRRNSCREVSAFSLKKEAEAGWLRPKIMRLLCGGTEGAAAVGGRGLSRSG